MLGTVVTEVGHPALVVHLTPAEKAGGHPTSHSPKSSVCISRAVRRERRQFSSHCKMLLRCLKRLPVTF